MSLIAIVACDQSSPTGGGNGNEGQQQVELNISVNPSDGGSTSPSSGSYDMGEEISVEAQPDDSFVFDSWSGDVSSQNNPVDIVMDESKNVTANFSQKAKSFQQTITISDGKNQKNLVFAFSDVASSDFEESRDLESPPLTPSGAFFAYFESSDGQKLFEDYRSTKNGKEAIWKLSFRPKKGSDINLSWNINSSEIQGSLKLIDKIADTSKEINMFENTSHRVQKSGITTMYIVYTRTVEKKRNVPSGENNDSNIPEDSTKVITTNDF